MRERPPSGRIRELVLVGGGHAHVQVLRRWAMAPLAGVRLTVVLDRAEAVYSGMVPGFVAGDYTAAECEIDVVPLARRAGARVILEAASELDAHARRIGFAERPALAYDVASLDVGSGVRGLELPGVAEHALATRPIRDFVDRLDAALARA
ncbi:MAG TPA: bifunctional NADH dehydrogenase FAD-containing subunit/selenide, water dikinase SelD, partial [Myxococcota bacterium]|nr:bifunctional NADH dehydrogenase FAD-containing subunit/selenide, water dikinase SelD [Myxococcota bacterium]